ncbi:hypothetical protein RvY_03173 [Ramazzottius varieornatus]|uniref:TGS domain-containing protein n=1 Tax=Ramazzottius varieornatus TaxID=947166 RepID=A0A1D1UXC2_RAMVA|nr:hypothetical protein RvY_03173 [Ramazzottius varieornatus]
MMLSRYRKLELICRKFSKNHVRFLSQPNLAVSADNASSTLGHETSSDSSTKAAITNDTIRARRNALFSAEKTRQIESVRRIEKIEVVYRGQNEAESCTLMMNKHLSTPYDCTLHIKQMIARRSALAVVDGKPWDMHRPLNASCDIQFLHFLEENPYEANMAFWRTGSLLLSYVADRAFRDDFFVQVHSWPYQELQPGSFLCDVGINLPEWTPREEELRAMTLIMTRLIAKKLPIERLEVSADLALKMFEDNQFKKAQIPSIAEKSASKERVTLYRVDDHVEISNGPMIANTGLFGRHQLTAVHPVNYHGVGQLYRFQGVALPAQQPLNYFAWNILQNRGRQFNSSSLSIVTDRKTP